MYFSQIPSDLGLARTIGVTIGEARAIRYQFTEEVLKSWQQERGYRPQDLDRLRAIEEGLELARMKYLFFEVQGRRALIRVYDGSEISHHLDTTIGDLLEISQIFSEGGIRAVKAQYENRRDDQKIPIERKYPDYQLPARLNSEADMHSILELGLLNIDYRLYGGFEVILKAVADLVDYTYNDSNYFKHGSLRLINQSPMRNPIIFALARPSNGKLYERFGFEPSYLIHSGTGAESTVLPDGLRVYTYTGRRLVKRYGLARANFALRGQVDTWKPEEAMDSARLRMGLNAWKVHVDRAQQMSGAGILGSITILLPWDAKQYLSMVEEVSRLERKLGPAEFNEFIAKHHSPLRELDSLWQRHQATLHLIQSGGLVQ
jgi:hypothetical protein